jgi:hypothetical protein
MNLPNILSPSRIALMLGVSKITEPYLKHVAKW